MNPAKTPQTAPEGLAAVPARPGDQNGPRFHCSKLQPILARDQSGQSAFTATEFSAALGVHRRLVHWRLRDTPPTATKFVVGQPANAWTLAVLPPAMRAEISAIAQRLGCRDAAHLLLLAPGAWQPAIPLSACSTEAVTKARRLQQALLPALQRRNDTTLSAGEKELLGLADYARVFARTITARHWRELLRRTLWRDGGLEDFARLDLFLDERPAQQIPTRDEGFEFVELDAALATLADAAAPTPAEVAGIWHAAFEDFERAWAGGRSEMKTRRAVIAILKTRAPVLAQSVAGLKRSFNRKLQHWRANGRKASALLDRRPAANRARRVVLPLEDQETIYGIQSAKHAGKLKPAFVECVRNGDLSPEICARYGRAAERNQIPKTVARDLAPMGRRVWELHVGERHGRATGPYIEMDWSDTGAGDWFGADDFTLELAAYQPDGAGWFILTRGQFIPFVDARSKRILDFVLIPDKNYTGVHIRTLINRIGRRYGLPRRGYHFESGIWKNSQLVGGGVSWGEFEMTFASRLGLHIRHSQPGNAKGKGWLENAGKLFQSHLVGEPGWVGGNERLLKLERVQAAKRDVLARRVHPAEAGFYSFDQWFSRLHELVAEYNGRPQDSRVMGGNRIVRMSPDQAWEELQPRNAGGDVVPLVKLPENCAYLLASHARKERVGRNGIKLPKSFGGGLYRNEVTGRLLGRCVNVYFDPEQPQTISIVSDDRAQVFTVPLAPPCPYDATPEQIAAAQASVSAHNRYARALYSQIVSHFIPPTRANVVDVRTAEVGQEMLRQRKAISQATERQRRADTRVRALARQVGIAPEAIAADSTEAQHSLELIRKALDD